MVQLDIEDMNFLKDLAEELRRHNGVYDPEAEELENIIIRAEGEDTISFKRALDLVWDQILQEERKNFTPEFRENVKWVVKTIKGDDK